MPVGVRCLWEKYFLRKQSASGSLLVRPCVYQADASPCDSQRAVWVLLASACVTVCAVWSVPRSVGNPHRHSNALQRPSLYVRLFARRITSTHTHALLLSTKRCSPRSYRIGRKRFEKVSNKERSPELARCFRNLTNVPAVCTIFEMIPFFPNFRTTFSIFLGSNFVWSNSWRTELQECTSSFCAEFAYWTALNSFEANRNYHLEICEISVWPQKCSKAFQVSKFSTCFVYLCSRPFCWLELSL